MSAKISLQRQKGKKRWKEREEKERRRNEKCIHNPMKREIDWFTDGIKRRNA
jgi:hypothetical protein